MMDWEKAENNLRFYMKAYANVVSGIFVLEMVLIPLLRRFDAGERTQELYDDMIDIK